MGDTTPPCATNTMKSNIKNHLKPQSLLTRLSFLKKYSSNRSKFVASLCNQDGKRSFSMKLILWTLTQVAVETRQKLPNGFTYIEMCPTYIRTIRGCSSWAANEAWKTLKHAMGWKEASNAETIEMGAKLRPVRWGRRRGRNLVLSPTDLQDLNAAYGSIQFTPPMDTKTSLAYTELIGEVDVRPWWGESQRTQTVHCPIGSNHKNNDKNPSLVLWQNPTAKRIGGMCLGCGQKFAVVFHGSKAKLYAPSGDRTDEIPASHRIGP